MKALCLLIVGLVAGPAMAAPRTHCSSNEEIFFSCNIIGSEKVASVCGGADQTNEVTWVQYRFGAIEHTEMVYPKQKDGSREKFFSHFENHPEGGFQEIWFRVGGYRYMIASDYSVESGEKRDNHLVVYKGWKPISNFTCTETTVNNLYGLRDHIQNAHDIGFYNQK